MPPKITYLEASVAYLRKIVSNNPLSTISVIQGWGYKDFAYTVHSWAEYFLMRIQECWLSPFCVAVGKSYTIQIFKNLSMWLLFPHCLEDFMI
jgi:hypothetical protein